jgi:hypothetical protein
MLGSLYLCSPFNKAAERLGSPIFRDFHDVGQPAPEKIERKMTVLQKAMLT